MRTQSHVCENPISAFCEVCIWKAYYVRNLIRNVPLPCNLPMALFIDRRRLVQNTFVTCNMSEAKHAERQRQLELL